MYRRFMLMLSVLGIFLLMAGCEEQKEEENVYIEQEAVYEKNTYDTLNVATYVTKIGDTYFLNDCYHDQIICHDNLEDPLTEWSVLTNEVHYAHTVAGDGTVLLTDDTENNRVLVFTKAKNGYIQTQTIEGIGLKPHYVQYDKKRDAFYVWSSITGELYELKREEGTNTVYQSDIKKIDELYGVYVRSYTIIEDDIYFVSGHNNRKIIQANLDTMEILSEYEVPGEIAGMVQLTKIQDYFYLTVSTDDKENQDYATIVRTKNLAGLIDGDYEDIYDTFGLEKGTPYYITEIDGTYYMTHHRTSENVISFQVIENEITDVKIIY